MACICFFLTCALVFFSATAADQSQNVYAESEDEFDDDFGRCMVLYNFEGTFELIYTPFFHTLISSSVSLTCVCFSRQQ